MKINKKIIKKKSQMIVGSQMTILFSLIAGAFIIIFFVTLTTSVRSNADKELNQNLIIKMKEMLKNARDHINSLDIAIMPTEIQFKNHCEGFYLENIPKISNDYIFAPDAIKGRLFYFYSTQVLMPFYVNDISLISTEKINNIFVIKNGEASIFINELMNSDEEISFPNFHNTIIDVGDLLDNNKMKKIISRNDIETRFIYFGDDPSVNNSIKNLIVNINSKRYIGDFYLIHVNDDYDLTSTDSKSKINDVNEIEYYRFNKNKNLFITQDKVFTYGKTFLHAAINVDSKLSYDCQIELLQKDYQRLSKLYISKTEEIIRNLDVANTGSAINSYTSINNSLNILLNVFNGSIDFNKANYIKSNINSIKTYQNLLRSSSKNLPLIY
ncbi:MAG: hypothetical protein PHT94_03955 [Candidatus Nanoarchaeia archaeon]|nr:hypothetical protein [Candidatus Nanoarchaeia archaeon]